MEDGKSGYDPSPVNPLPAVVWIIAGLMFAVEAAFALGEAGIVGGAQAVGWRLNAIRDYGFSPEVLGWMMDTGQWPMEHVVRFVTYPFLHGGFVQMAIAGVIFLAMGKMVAQVMGSIAVVVIFFGSSILGAAAYGILLEERSFLFGAFPGAFGLIGGYTFVMWFAARLTGGNQTRAFTLIAFLMGIQLVFGLLFGTDNTWVAELTGFLFGFLLSFTLVPAARAGFINRLRQR